LWAEMTESEESEDDDTDASCGVEEVAEAALAD
jgi:hypothetical protein